MGRTILRVVGGSLVSALLIPALAAPAAAGPSDTRRGRVAIRYIVSQQQDDGSVVAFSPVGSTADAVVAMVAAKRGPDAIDAALEYLASQAAERKVDGVGLKAKVVMAAVAGGRDPRDFGGRNLVRRIARKERRSGRLGRGTAVFDHALAMLALDAAGAPVPPAVSQWLADAQCGDGGWQYPGASGASENKHCLADSGDDFFTSDTNTTGLAVQALAAAPPPAPPARSAFAYLRSARDEVKGGWRYSHKRFSFGRVYTDANSTALVLQAYAARSRPPPSGSRKALRRLHYRLCGSGRGALAYSWTKVSGRLVRTGPDLGATIGGVLGFLEEPLPVDPVAVTRRPPSRRSCA